MRTFNAQTRRPARRDGMALVLALGAIVVIGAVVAGGFYVATRDVRVGRVTAAQERAQLKAEDALNAAREKMESNKPQIPSDGGILAYGNALVTRLNLDTYLISAAPTELANGGNDRASRRVSMVVYRLRPNMTIPGALTVRGETKIGGNSLISGSDANPSGWDCPPPGAAKPGVVTPIGNTIDFSGCKNGDCVSGNPDVEPNPIAAKDETYFQYGNTTWDDLKAFARTIAGGTYSQINPSYNADASCNTASAQNWGDPIKGGGATACENYYPIIYVSGDMHITGGVGQGVLLVEGDLDVQGGFEFYGPVIVKGALQTQGTGGHFNGGVMAANVNLDQNTVLGDALISYSSCAISTALTNAAPIVPVRQRAWAEMF
jgi:hypothetical protein